MSASSHSSVGAVSCARSSVFVTPARLALCVSVLALFAACGDDDLPGGVDAGPPTDAASADAAITDAGFVDGGPTDGAVLDAEPLDAGMPDAGPACPDDDGDGSRSASCGGDDCDDTRVDVNPRATESCNGGIDDDCDGLADAADGVCVPCPTGYAGFDRDCVDVDECATPDFCGAGASSCTNTEGGVVCACRDGFSVPPLGDACIDIDECVAGTDDCDTSPIAACSNVSGSYVCSCPPGFAGAGLGAGGCLFDDPSLTSLTTEVGSTLSPVFTSGVTTYELVLAPGAVSTVWTPSVEEAGRATITMDGATVASGTTVIVPAGSGFAPRSVTIVVTTESGASRTYTISIRRSNTYIKASNTGAGDRFGHAVSISGDGATLAVGARYEDSAATGVGGDQTGSGASDSGAVFIYRRSVAGTWAQDAYVKASNTGAGDSFGTAVALSADGNRLVVSAPDEDSAAASIDGDASSNAASQSGAVYVFQRSASGVWAQEAYVKAFNTNAGDQFGLSVALSADGTSLAVGAFGEDSAARGVGGDSTSNAAADAGSVYLFRRNPTGAWTQEAYVKAANADAADRFGWSVALSADGTTLGVGAHFEDSSATGVGGSESSFGSTDSGAVYVLRRSVAGVWAQEAYIKASNTDTFDHFGWSVALSADGATLAVGAEEESSAATGVDGDQSNDAASRSGAVYVFRRRALGMWSQEAYVKASNTGADDAFGHVVALSSDGSVLGVGANFEDSGGIGIDGDETSESTSNAGAVYVFRRSAGSLWAQEAYVKASNTGASDQFGYAVALAGDGSILVVGARFERSAATGIGGNQASNAAIDSGAVYVY